MKFNKPVKVDDINEMYSEDMARILRAISTFEILASKVTGAVVNDLKAAGYIVDVRKDKPDRGEQFVFWVSLMNPDEEFGNWVPETEAYEKNEGVVRNIYKKHGIEVPEDFGVFEARFCLKGLGDVRV